MAKKRILVIEDEQSIVDALTYNLTKEGFDVFSTLSGRDGVQMAKANPPDLIVLDLMLPELNGLEVCRELRSDSRTRFIRILVLSAKNEKEIVGVKIEADDYVTKPFKMKALVLRIQALLSDKMSPAKPEKASENQKEPKE